MHMPLLNNIYFNCNKKGTKMTLYHMHVYLLNCKRQVRNTSKQRQGASVFTAWSCGPISEEGETAEAGQGVFSSWKWGDMNKIWHFLSVAAVPVFTRTRPHAIREFMLNNCSLCKVTIVYCPSLWISYSLIFSTFNSVQSEMKL